MTLTLGAAFKRSGSARSPSVPPPFPEPRTPSADPVLPSPAETAEAVAHRFIGRNDVRKLTPRQMSALCGELFLATMISCDEYLMMAFQPELHPDYDRTIGALIGEKSDPDRPRDYIQRWTDRLDFEVKYNAKDTGLIARTRNILSVLRQLDAARNRLM
jgi:hypothetical protein